jgi:hypothetical protein
MLNHFAFINYVSSYSLNGIGAFSRRIDEYSDGRHLLPQKKTALLKRSAAEPFVTLYAAG